MLEIKYGANLTIPGRPQFSISNQTLQSEVYKHFYITLNANQDTEEIILSEVKKLNLLVVKATPTLAPGSLSKLKYKIDAGSLIELDAPLVILGTWVSSIVPDGLKMSFKLEPKPGKNRKFKSEVHHLAQNGFRHLRRSLGHLILYVLVAAGLVGSSSIIINPMTEAVLSG